MSIDIYVIFLYILKYLIDHYVSMNSMLFTIRKTVNDIV